MGYKGIIFDLDGTLLDTIQDIAFAMNSVLKRSDLPQHNPEAYKKKVGWGLRELVRLSLPVDFANDEIIDILYPAVVEAYQQRPIVFTYPYSGIPELLRELNNRKVPISVLSNKADSLVKKIVKNLLDDIRFVAVQGALPDKPKKPDPTLSLELAQKMGCNNTNMLFVGDSAIDMQTAAAADMHPIGVSWGFRARTELIENGATEIIDRPSQVLDFFDHN